MRSPNQIPNRTGSTYRIIEQLRDARNPMVIADRRAGKTTGLVDHVAARILDLAPRVLTRPNGYKTPWVYVVTPD